MVSDDKAIIDTKLYQESSQDQNEAYSLMAIINSITLAKVAITFCPTNWSKDIRHLHKLPIPEFDPNNPDHADLSRLGRRADVEAENAIAGLGDPVPSVTKARSVLRHEWQPNSGVARGLLR